MTGRKENIKNNQELRLFYERELMLAWDDFYMGKSSRGEILDLDWFYYENWVEPIIETSPFDVYYLN